MNSIPSLTPDEIRHRVEALGPWFHNIDLCGINTANDHFLGDYPRVKWEAFRDALPSDLSDKTVLDIGCNGGFYSIEMKKRGAKRVLGIDSDLDYLAQARFAADVLHLDIEFAELSVYDVASLGERFDIVLFMGVLYHLRHPLLALDLIHAEVAKDMLVFQAMQRGSPDANPIAENYAFSEDEQFERDDWPKLYFIEKNYASDPTNWWIPNRACSEAMLRSSGFTITAHPEAEVYLCKRGERPPHVDPVYPARRLRS